MATDQWKIRLVRQADNYVLTHLLSKVLIKLNVPKQGTVFTDPEFDSIYYSFLLDNLIIRSMVLENILLVSQVLPHCLKIRVGIGSCKKCIFLSV